MFTAKHRWTTQDDQDDGGKMTKMTKTTLTSLLVGRASTLGNKLELSSNARLLACLRSRPRTLRRSHMSGAGRGQPFRRRLINPRLSHLSSPEP